MADANATTGTVCYHCNQSLTRPDIDVRTSSIPATLSCGGLAASQIVLVNETVAETLADISELDREISRFRAAIEELELKRTALQSFANVHKSLLNPVSRLPAEVLSQIFQHCVIVSWTQAGGVYYPPDNGTPMAIASVGRQWRDVALSTPRLWSAISLVLRPKDAKQHIALAGMWLSRAGNSPLSIRLETQKNIRDPMRKVLEVFAAKSTRWRNIYFRLPLPMLEWMSFIKSRLPNLEMLELGVWDEGTPLTKMDLFADAPRLHTFFAGTNVTKSTLALHWNLIRIIKVSEPDISIPDAIDLVALAPNIEDCELRLQKYNQDPIPAHAIVQLPKLRSVSVEFYGRSSTPYALFTTLCMPNLCQLSLVTPDTSWEPLVPPLASLCSQASLRKLALQTRCSIGHWLAGRDIVQILKAARQLQVLEILDYQPKFISNDFLQAFGQLDPSGIPVLCPNLQTFCFRPPSNTILASFALTLHKRGSSGTQNRLKTVTIVCHTSEKAQVEETLQTSAWLDQLRDAGINMQLRD